MLHLINFDVDNDDKLKLYF